MLILSLLGYDKLPPNPFQIINRPTVRHFIVSILELSLNYLWKKNVTIARKSDIYVPFDGDNWRIIGPRCVCESMYFNKFV